MKLILASAILFVLLTGLESKPHKKPKDIDECVCLHGGTCIYHRTRSRCACPIGYTGMHCEKDLRSKCYKDNGNDYRGLASKTSNGFECLPWDSPLLKNFYFNAQMKDGLNLGLGKHNYCRNPNNGVRPWCYFKGPTRVASMFCQLPKCETEENTEESTESTCGRRQHKMYKIVGGNSNPIESQPWTATLYQVNRRNKKEQYFQCGGSLIHPCWVLTAAHCFPDSEFPEPKDYAIILGKSSLAQTNEINEQKFEVEKIIRHQDYSDSTNALNNDIALIKIRSASGKCASMTNSVQTVCLPTADLKMSDRAHCEIAGFGKESHDSHVYSQVLKSASVQLISQELCQSEQYYGKLINNNMFCAGDPEWKVDACKGDSGGPLVCQHNGQMTLYGIISWGEGCAKENKPGVYTRITTYLPWIEENMVKAINFHQ